MKKIGLVFCSLFLLSACGKEKPRLEGDRQSIVEYTSSIAVDSSAAQREIGLSQPHSNTAWSQASGDASHAMPPLSFSNQFLPQWSQSIGTGSRSDARLLTTPIVAEDRTYTLDTRMRLRAFDSTSGDRLWEQDLTPQSKSGVQPGGGLSYEDGRIFAATPYAEVLAVNAASGEILWRASTEAPLRAAPTVSKGRVYVLSINNQLDVYEASTGNKLWSHAGITEFAGLLGTASPAVSKGVVVVAYSSGEIYALRADNGHELWSETLSPTRRPDSLSSLAHIKARPIIDDWNVYIVGHNQKMAAFDLRTGQRIWERRIGGIKTPAVVSDYIFLVNNFNELVCLLKSTGEVAWIQKLPTDPENPNRIIWSGPVVAGGQLYLTGLTGEVLTYSPRGEPTKTFEGHGDITLPPVVAKDTMYLLTDSGKLKAFR